jgi:hypothetical protein
LQQDILGPPDKAGEISLWLQLTTNPEVLWALLEQMVDHFPLGDLLAAAGFFLYIANVDTTCCDIN